MTVEQAITRLEREGWDVWHLGRTAEGGWTCRLYSASVASRVVGKPGATGFDLECWRYGTGPTIIAAITAASPFQSQEENGLDLAMMLG